jgi:hypothetical protein
MSYSAVILADGPQVYFRLDETGLSSSSTPPNLGVAGGTGSMQGTVTNIATLQTPAGIIDGSAWHFNSGPGWCQQFVSGLTSTKNFTIEGWFKRDMGYSGLGSTIQPFKIGSAYIGINSYSTGQMLMYNGSSYPINDNFPSVIDGAWHHLALTYDGSTFIFYIDGAQASTGATTSPAAYTSTTFAFGGTTSFGCPGWIDEPAFYNKVLTPTRIAAHNTAGRVTTDVSISISAPAMTASAMAPDPAVTTVRQVSNSVPAMTASEVMPAPGIIADDRMHYNYLVTADTDSQGFVPTNDTVVISNDGSGNTKYIFTTDDPRLPNTAISSMILHAYMSAPYGTATLRAGLVTSTWSEGSTSFTLGTPTANLITLNNLTMSPVTVDLSVLKSKLNAGQPWLGFYLELTTSTHNVNVYTKERGFASSAQAPYIETTLIPQVSTPVTVNAPVATGSATMSDAAISTGTKSTVTVATSTSVMVAPVVSSNRSISISLPAMTSSSAMVDATIVIPDRIISTTPMQGNAVMPVANGFGGNDLSVSVPAMIGSGDTVAPGFTNMTTTSITVPPMTATAKMIGLYDKSKDRYLAMVPTTIDADDVWFQMEELGGTTVNDSSIDTAGHDPKYAGAGTYNGGPVFGVEGPQLRKAVHFDGVDDCITYANYPSSSLFTFMDTTIEFSLRTTQQNGTIIKGAASSGASQGATVRLVNGQIVIHDVSSNLDWTVRKTIADGQWHHIVISDPYLSANHSNVPALDKPFFVMIDGSVEFQRYNTNINGRSLLPYSIMANVTTDGTNIVTDALSGDMRDFIARLNYAVSPNTATKLYYEWSESLLVNATPMVGTALAKAPVAKGNAKKMLLVYGLESSFLAPNDSVYHNVFAGYDIEKAGAGNAGNNSGVWTYYYVKPFYLQDFLVYPVSIIGGSVGARDVDGVTNKTYVDPLELHYVDDKTGLSRFIDFDLDLLGDVTQFDALSVMNYPAERQFHYEYNLNNGAQTFFSDFIQHLRYYGLSDSEWTTVRDKFRDTILGAAYKGVNLWITEPHAAEHLGFIKSWDIHDSGRWDDGGIGQTASAGRRNLRAEQLDKAHVADLTNHAGLQGDYIATFQANSQRRIVDTEHGLTDIPGYEITDEVAWLGYDRFNPYADIIAYDVVYKAALAPGDLTRMSMASPYWDHEVGPIGYRARMSVISARPQGVAGKIIAREQQTYYGPEGVVVDNPYKDNVITIAAERGTVVRGRPIQGRAFLEFMDTGVAGSGVAVDRYPDRWGGQRTGVIHSTWSFDMRRNLGYSSAVQTDPSLMQQYNAITDTLPSLSMNGRGLKWLANVEQIPTGDARVYVPAMNVQGEMETVTSTHDRNLAINVSGTMRAMGEIIKPANINYPDVTIQVYPMEASAKWTGVPKSVNAEPMSATAVMPGPQVIAGGDRINVYLDMNNNFTVYLKEE